AAVAAFFALHPLHVQSVAWASERKDVISAFFWIAASWLYCAYARQSDPRRRRVFFAATVAVFALGLMAKPMLVTLPCVFFLLDFWPLRRAVPVARLVVEKIPFFLLSAIASVITVFAQKEAGALQSLVIYTLKSRLENTPVAYVRYLVKMFWPSGL